MAVFSYVNAQLAEGVTQDQIDSALDDLSGIYGEEVTTQEQAKEICNEERYIADCAEIGKEHNLFPPDRVEQVDAILEEIKGSVSEQIKSCQSIECLVGVAEGLASRITRKDPTLASQIDLTPRIVREKKEIVDIAKSVGVTIDQCIEMDPDTATVEALRACARLAKESKVQKYIPIETRAQTDIIAESTERTAQLKESLSSGRYQCGNNTIDGCGNFCLNPGTEARAEGGSAIPSVCKEIAAQFFGSQGVRELENAYSRVSGVADYYYKKAQNFVFTTLDGQTLTNPEEIGAYLEGQGRAGNVEAVSKGMDFMVSQGFATQADKDFAVKMVSRFRERGGVDFDTCVNNPRACQDYIHEEFKDDFNVMEQVFDIMRQELGFSPDLCEQGQFDESIGLKCLEGGKRALPKIEALALQYPQVRFIVEEIRSHLQRGDQLAQKRNEFRGGTLSGPGGCRNEKECFVYCSNPVNGPECIAFGAKENISGFTGDQAAAKYQQYDYNLNRQAIEERNITSSEPVFGPYGDAVYQSPFYGDQRGQPPYGPYPPYGQPYGPGPGYPPSPPGSQSPYGPSPECLRAITSGDFVRAKEFCNVGGGGTGGPQPYPYPSVSICPVQAVVYEACPADQYHESFRNSDGCWVDGPCKPIPTYSPGPYPTYPPGPYPTYSPGPGGKPQCSDGIDNDNDGKTDYPADTSCYGPDDFDEYYPPEGGPYPTGPYPTYSPGPGGSSCSQSLINLLGNDCHQMYSDPSGRQIYCDGPMTKSAKEGDTATTPGCSYSGGPTYTPYPGSGWEGQYPGQCSDGIDNDGDGLIDSADSSCTTPPPIGGSCPAGYHSHGEQGGFCMNDQENYGGICYSADGKTKITCPPSGSQCAPPQWWDPAKGYCVGSTSPSPWPSPGIGSCPAGYHYHSDSGGFCMNDREDYAGTCYTSDGKSTTTCPKSNYPSPQTCPSGQWWDYARNACVSSSTTYTPAPSCPSGQWWDYTYNKCTSASACGAGYYWDSASNMCKPSGGTTTYTPYPSAQTCPSGQWWDYARNACVSSTATYTPYPTCSGSQWWDPAKNACTCGNGYSWDSASNTCKSNCASGQWWDSATNSCQSIYATPTYTPSGYCGDYICSSSESSSSCPSDCGGGTPPTYTPYPTCPSGQWWDSVANSCMGSTTTYTPPPSCPSGQWWDSASNSCMGSTTTYTPYPTTSPSPSPTSALYYHMASLHCAEHGRSWDGKYCQPNGFLARVFENTLANLGKLLGL